MIDLVLVTLFVGYAVAEGFRSKSKASRSQHEYFLAGRQATGWQAGLSMAASQYAADTPLLATGLMATAGVYALWRFWIYGFGYLLLGFVFAELWRRAGVLTDAELTETRYSGRGVLALRTLKAVYYGTVVNCFFLAMVLIAAVRIAEVFMPWHEWLPAAVYEPIRSVVAGLEISLGASGLDPATAATNGLLSILIIVSFVLLYSATGGLRSVIATDVVQFGCIMIGILGYAWIVMAEMGGPSAFGERLVELYGRARSEELTALMPSGGAVLWPFLAILGLQGLFWISSDGTGYLAQRAMACRSDQDARIAGVVTTWAQMLFRSVIWLVIGGGLLVLYPFTPADAAQEGFAAARELTFIRGIDDLLPPGLRGLMLVGMLAALASTVDTHLNWGASYWSVDLYDRLYCRAWRKRKPSQRALLRVARLSNVVVLLIALAIMVNLGSIQATWFISLVFGAGIGGVLMLRWLWHRINLWSEAAAIAVSLVASPFILAWVEAEWARLAWVVTLSNGAAVIAALVGPETDPGVVRHFYGQVRPLGWWRAIAGDDSPMRAFRKRLWFVVWMTASLFLALIGSVKLLLPLPGDSAAWGWACLALAAALSPLWLPSLRTKIFDDA